MAKALDLTNQRFGKLVVISRTENTKRGNTQWLCKCDCGKEKVALGYDLTHNRTVSCGCNLQGTISPSRVDLVGKKFGKLTVESLYESRNGNLYWKCRCECGNEKIISGANLKSGKGLSCGCDKYGKTVIDIAGNRYGKLTVISRAEKKDRGWTWNCICDCGKSIVALGEDLKSNHKKSCGCLVEEQRHKPKRIIHGNSTKKSKYNRLYQEWLSMLNRCKPTYHMHHRYFDRGIKVCNEWHEYSNFKSWALENGYSDNLTLDRKDNDGDYEPLNCRWATLKQQANNTCQNVLFTYQGKTQTMKQWSEELGLNYGTIKARHRRGMTPPQLFEPIKSRM